MAGNDEKSNTFYPSRKFLTIFLTMVESFGFKIFKIKKPQSVRETVAM